MNKEELDICIVGELEPLVYINFRNPPINDENDSYIETLLRFPFTILLHLLQQQKAV